MINQQSVHHSDQEAIALLKRDIEQKSMQIADLNAKLNAANDLKPKESVKTSDVLKVQQCVPTSDCHLFNDVIDKLPFAVGIFSDCKIVFANIAFIKLMKGDCTLEIVGKNIADFVLETSMQFASERMQLLKEGKARSTPVNLRCKALNGSELDLEVDFSLVNFQGDSAIMASIKDVTDLYAYESRLVESEQRYKSLTETAPIAVAVITDGYIAYANPAVVNLFGGKSKEEFIGRSPFEFIHKDFLERSFISLSSALNGEFVVTRESQFIRTDGVVLDVEVTINRVIYGGKKSVQVIIRDVTQSKRAISALRKSEVFARGIANNLPGYLSYWDQNFVCVFGNSAYAERYGFADSELAGKHMSEVLPNDVFKRMKRYVSTALSGTPCGYHIRDELTLNRDLWVQFKPHIHEDVVLGVFVLATDITQLKIAELEANIAKEEAERASGAKSRFLAAASHDLRQPMAAIALYVDELSKSVQGQNHELVQNIQRCVDGMSGLLADLLDVSKFDAGVVSVNKEDFKLHDFLDEIRSTHLSQARDKGLELRIRECSCYGFTDVGQAKRIINNVVSNAIKYTEKGGILIACRHVDGKQWIQVWDTGIGIPKGQTSIIFEEFKQLGDDARNKGSGLGLAIVAKACALLGLEIRVSSVLGRGSMFAVEIPEGQLTKEPVEKKNYLPAPQRIDIMLVEDNLDLLQAMSYAFSRAGYTVYAGQSYAEALEEVGSVAPDIFISDYRLANQLTGLDAITDLHEHFGRKIPSILITGDTDPDLIKKMYGSGVIVMHKPVRIPAIKEAITNALNNAEIHFSRVLPAPLA